MRLLRLLRSSLRQHLRERLEFGSTTLELDESVEAMPKDWTRVRHVLQSETSVISLSSPSTFNRLLIFSLTIDKTLPHVGGLAPHAKVTNVRLTTDPGY